MKQLAITVILFLFVGCLPSAADDFRLLKASGWSGANARSMLRWLDRCSGPVTAVFDHDGTLIHGDLCEGDGGDQPGLFKDNLLHGGLKAEGMRRIPAEGLGNPWAHYLRLEEADRPGAYAWLTSLLAGYPVQEARAVGAGHYSDVNRFDIFPAMQALLEVLRRRGVEIWIVSASPDVLVKAASAWTGIPVGRIIGIGLRDQNGILTGDVELPVTYAAGKTLVIQRRIQPLRRENLMVFGNSWSTDGHMLRYATRGGGFGLMINPGPGDRKALRKCGVFSQSLPSTRKRR